MKKSESIFGLLRIPLDFAMVVLAFIWGYKLRLKGDFIPNLHFELHIETFPLFEDYLPTAFLFAGMLVLVFAFMGLYRFKNTEGPLHESKNILKAGLVWLFLLMAYFFAIHEVFFSRLVLAFSVILTCLLILTARFLLRRIQLTLLSSGIGRRRVLILGKNKISEKIAAALKKDPHYEVVGLKKPPSIKQLTKEIHHLRVDTILQTDQDLTELQDHDILELCQEKHLEYHFVPDILAMERSNIAIQAIAGFPIIHLKPTRLDGWGKIIKRLFDLSASGLALILLSPLFLLIAIGIKIDSPGPVLFCRLDDGAPANRIGQFGKPFQFFKFRSMRHKSHDERRQLKKDSHRSGPLMKVKNDPRITRFGSFLRRSSLDELPQLWNVFKGNMSLVGPRPHLPEEVADYEKHHKFLLTIKPGITGISQISGRSDLNFDEEVRLDTYYIKHWSLFFDFKILLKTIMVVLKGTAAD